MTAGNLANVAEVPPVTGGSRQGPAEEGDFTSARRTGKRSLRLLAARNGCIDPRHQLWRQRAGIGSGYALSKLLSILNPKHECVDIKR